MSRLPKQIRKNLQEEAKDWDTQILSTSSSAILSQRHQFKHIAYGWTLATLFENLKSLSKNWLIMLRNNNCV